MLSEKPKGGLSETRKMTKSTMEKRRRQRINNSLTELKSILAGMITHKGERFDKMEKADILEMTVKCVRQLQKQANSGDGTRLPGNVSDDDYKSGMHKCMSEVIKFISSSNFADADPAVKTKLLDHLANKLSESSVKASPETLYKRHSCSSDDNSNYCSKLADDFSDTDNDLSDNVRSESGRDAVFSPPLPQTTQGNSSPKYTSGTQKVQETSTPAQLHIPQTNMPTVPLTILVPANLCSTAIGTTCVIPLNIPGVSPPQLNQTGFVQTIPGQASSLAASGHLSFQATSGIPLVSNQNALFAATQTSSLATNILPENNRTTTFSPTVITDNINKIKITSAPISSSSPIIPLSNSQLLSSSIPKQTQSEISSLSDDPILTNSLPKISPSSYKTVALCDSENCSRNTEMTCSEDTAFRAVADSTTTSPNVNTHQDHLCYNHPREAASEYSKWEPTKPTKSDSRIRNQRTFLNVPYPPVPNAQNIQVARRNNHWRPW